MKRNITLHLGTEKEIPELFGLVKELADYEKAPEEVKTSVDIYKKDFKEGLFEFTCAKDESGTVLGIILYYPTYSTWKGKMLYLEDFVVKQNERQQGIGDLLFDRFIEIAKEKKCNLVKWQVLDWNEPALAFYRKKNAIIEKEWWNGKIIFEHEPNP